VGFHSSVGNRKLRVVYQKYFDPKKGAIVVLPLAKGFFLSIELKKQREK